MATGPDGMSGHMLRNTAPSIPTQIFNLSLHHQSVPAAWKASNINPIPKANDTGDCSNYSPISLLSLLSILSSTLSKHDLLSNVQFGFRPRASTQEALLSVTNTWHSLLTKHSLDVKKAFDSVPHHQLIRSLHAIGVQGPLLNWFRDYLTSRSQRVVLDGETSSTVPITS